MKRVKTRMKYLQVEVTRNCDEKCRMCPHRKWNFGGELKFDCFVKISRFFSSFEIVYLQGWGEPLQHSKFFEMLEIAKSYAKTGFTTNGKRLAKNAEKVVEFTDYLLVSFAGVTSKSRGVKFDKAIEGIKAVSEVNTAKVRVGASYMLTSESWKECSEFVKLAHEAGVKYIAFTNLDYVFDEITDEMRVFDKPISKDVEKEVEKAKSLAKKLGIEVKTYPLKSEELPVCEANPHLSLTVSCDCKIYPCIYLSLPFDKIQRIFRGKIFTIERPDFGYIFDDSAWKKYFEFVEVIKKRIQEYDKALYDVMNSSPFTALRKLEKVDDVLKSNPPPEFCTGCYKLYGI